MVKGVNNMKKQYSRKELLHVAIKSIRISLELAIDSKKRNNEISSKNFYNGALIKAYMLVDIHLISMSERDLLVEIIDRIYFG